MTAKPRMRAKRAGQTVVPCFVPAFNNPTYVRQTLDQLSRFPTLKPVVLDNASTYDPMVALCEEIDAGRYGGAQALRLGCNAGPRAVWYNLDAVPTYFCITDPDLLFNAALPDDFLDELIDLTETYLIGKAGFALCIDDRELMLQEQFRHCEGRMTIWEAEAKNWQVSMSDSERADPLYLADIDTTFALYNKAHFDITRPFEAIRVAGRYTARHLPWYVENGLPADEAAFYRKNAEFSYYMGDRPAIQVRRLFAQQEADAALRPSLVQETESA